MIGQLQYGPPIMNMQADRTQEGSLSRVAWDDEGVPADQWLIVEKGVFKDYQTTREQVARIQKLTGVTRSHGCSFAESWNAVQFQRMPNISLLPGDKDIGVNEIVAATERGILIRNAARGRSIISATTSSSRDRPSTSAERQDRRHAARRRVSGNTPVFWRSMDMIGGKSSYWMGGAFNDGKGEPSQSNSVSHGCVPARFRNVTILNTARSS